MAARRYNRMIQNLGLLIFLSDLRSTRAALRQASEALKARLR